MLHADVTRPIRIRGFALSLGSIVSIADASGTASHINRYDEYGVSGPSNTGRIQHTGQAWLAELGVELL